MQREQVKSNVVTCIIIQMADPIFGTVIAYHGAWEQINLSICYRSDTAIEDDI